MESRDSYVERKTALSEFPRGSLCNAQREARPPVPGQTDGPADSGSALLGFNQCSSLHPYVCVCVCVCVCTGVCASACVCMCVCVCTASILRLLAKIEIDLFTKNESKPRAFLDPPDRTLGNLFPRGWFTW